MSPVSNEDSMTKADRRSICIACDHVCVAYRRQEVLHDVCLQIPSGMLLPFVGPNGAGKTTLLRAMLGLIKPSRGFIHTPFAKHSAGYVPQQKAIDPLYPVSARQIVEMGLYPELGWRKHPDSAQRKRVDAVLERFSLTEHQHKTFGELSGGTKQKALLGRALVHDADVLIMDEPTSELDEASEREVMAHLAALARDEGKTILLAHHGLDQARRLASTLCVVRHGRAYIVSAEEAGHLLEGTFCVEGDRHA